MTSGIVDNDGTNSCVFMTILLADMLIKRADELPVTIDEWSEIANIVEGVIKKNI